MSVTSDVRDELTRKLLVLDPEGDGFRNLTQAVKVISDADINDRKLDFDIDKEETRKLEKSNEYVAAQADVELKKIDLVIHAIDVALNPGQALTRIVTTKMNNRCKKERDIMGYNYEDHGVIGSTTLNNALKDKYD